MFMTPIVPPHPPNPLVENTAPSADDGMVTVTAESVVTGLSAVW